MNQWETWEVVVAIVVGLLASLVAPRFPIPVSVPARSFLVVILAASGLDLVDESV